MRYYHDWEFYEDGERIHPISVGIVAQDGRKLYLEFPFDWSIVPSGHRLWENVYPHLTGFAPLPPGEAYEISKDTPADLIRKFITQDGTEFSNELWGYYSSYDHVCLAQTFGRMVDLPDGIPMFTRDIKQEQERLSDLYFKHGLLLPEHKGTTHNALDDAIWTKQAHEFLTRVGHEYYGTEIVDGWA